jgi:hypothetical protein
MAEGIKGRQKCHKWIDNIENITTTEPEFVNVQGAQESFSRNRFRQAGNRFLGSFHGLQIRAQDM